MNFHKWVLGRQGKQRGSEREEWEESLKPLNPPIVPAESGLNKDFQGAHKNTCVCDSARDKSGNLLLRKDDRDCSSRWMHDGVLKVASRDRRDFWA